MNKTHLLSAPLRAVVTILLLALAGFWATPRALAQANANPPERMTYQGFLTDGDGTALATNAPKNYDVILRVWDAQSGGTSALWAEQQTVTVDKGYFSVLLGEGTEVGAELHNNLSALFTSATASDRFVEMTVKGIGAGSPPADVTMLPRLRLLTSPYAFLASRVSGAGVIAANNLDPTIASSLWTASGANIYRSGGNVGIGTAAPLAKLQVGNPAFGWASPTFQVFGGGLGATAGNSTTLGSFNCLPDGGNEVSLAVKAVRAVGGANGWGGTAVGLTYDVDGVGPVGGQLWFKGGNVGIGTTSPGYPLTVNGRIASGGPGTGGIWVDGGSAQFVGSVNASQMGLYNGLTAGWGLVLQNNGNVGIGGEPSDARLRIVTSAANHGNGTVVFEPAGLGGSPSHIHHGGNGDWYIRSAKSGGKVILQDTGGNVGIGTSSPTQAKLVVLGSGGNYALPGGYGFFNKGDSAFNYPGDPAPYSIYADSRIACPEFNAFSDARIKTIVGRSDGVSDLATLQAIEITDYRHKDVVQKGTRVVKKVIAQQVEKIYPQAVSQTTDVVPDIYQKASIKDGWVILATNLRKGERVRLIGEKGDGIHEVLEVAEGKFRTDCKLNDVSTPAVTSPQSDKLRAEHKPEGDQIFVYGREVKDFRSVDYDAIAMLNVSATQELARQVEGLRKSVARIAQLGTENMLTYHYGLNGYIPPRQLL